MAEKKAVAKAPQAKPATAKAPAKAKVAAASAISLRGTCSAEKCQRPLRAKGYCRKHFMAWRRGSFGAHHQYKTCTKEACRKKREFGGLCAEHAGKAPAEGAAPGAAT